MTTVEEIERALERLPPAELEQFREWYSQFDAERFDARIELDAGSGRLDALAHAALREHRQGRSRDI